MTPEISPDNPAQASNQYKVQEKVENRYELVSGLLNAGENEKNAFVSTYTFPRGHTDDGDNIPKVETIFIDFDIPKDSEYRDGNYTLDAWKRSMSDLLIRVQMVADALLESGKAKHWRASLSGHKGVHLFFDFDEIHPANGTYAQFRNGLGEYGRGMIEKLDEIAGGINIEPWMDVDSSDLARLVRHPNTRHFGAKHVDESWCVPITIEELSTLTVEDYLELTSSPREIPDGYERNPSTEAMDEISLVIRDAGGRSSPSSSVQTPSKSGHSSVRQYKEESNSKISVSDIPFLVKNKPCIMEFIERDDGFQYGNQSRVMEIQIIKELIQKKVPIDVIANFFRPVNGWDNVKSHNLIEDLIVRYDGPFTCKNVWEDAPEFCVEDGCKIYRDQYEKPK